MPTNFDAAMLPAKSLFVIELARFNLLYAIAALVDISAFTTSPSVMSALTIEDFSAKVPNPKFVLAPLAVVDPVPPFVTDNVPVTPVVSGNPVAFVNTPEEGVPSAGVVKVGLVSVLLVRVSDPANVASVPVVGKVIFVAFVETKVVE